MEDAQVSGPDDLQLGQACGPGQPAILVFWRTRRHVWGVISGSIWY